VYATTIVGRPPMEDYYLGHATERIFLPLLKLTVTEIVDYHMPAEESFTISCSSRSTSSIPGQAYKVMNAMWGQGLMSLAKVMSCRQGSERPERARGLVGCAQSHRSGARRQILDGDRSTSSTIRAGRSLRIEDGIDATRKWRRKDSRATGRS